MKNLSLLLVAGSLGLVLGACDNQPAKDKPRAEVAAPVATSAAAPTATATTYEFSAGDSKLEWVGAKVTGKHDGAFEKFTGTITGDGTPEKSSVTVEIDTKSVTSDADKLTEHLKSADFFDVEKHPKAKFVSTSIKPGGDKGATHTITGNLDLHGVTKSITFPATVKMTPEQVTVDAEFAINRKDFQIVYAGKPDDLIKDDVLIKLKIVAKKQG